MKESTSSNGEPTAGTHRFVQEFLNRADQEDIWNQALGINEKAMMIGATPYQKSNIVKWSFLDQDTKHLPFGSNHYAEFIAEVEDRSATRVRLKLLAWREYGTENYRAIAKLTNRPLSMIELFTSGEVIVDEICRGKLVELTARITAGEGRMLFKVGTKGLKTISLEGSQGGLKS
jgi:hypothetical protein